MSIFLFVSFYACRVEDLVNKGWPENDAEMSNREYVNVFIQGLPIKLKRSANEKKLVHIPTLEEPVISFEVLIKCINRKHIANEMTPSHEVNYNKPTLRHQHHSRQQVRHQNDPNNKASPEFYTLCNCFRKSGLSILHVSNNKQMINEKQTVNPENKTNNNHPKGAIEKTLWTFSGTTNIYLLNELPLPTTPYINQIPIRIPKLNILLPTKFPFTWSKWSSKYK